MGTIRITITKEGKITREAFGFTGPACTEKTQFLDDLLGAPKTEELKDSYYVENVIKDTLPSGWCG